MNPVFIPITSVKFKSAFLHTKWAENILKEILCICQIENLLMVKIAWGHLHQILGKWAGRNLITASRVNSLLVTHARIQRWIWHLQLPWLPTDSYFWMINSLMASCGVCLTWLDCNIATMIYSSSVSLGEDWWRPWPCSSATFSHTYPINTYKTKELLWVLKGSLLYLKGHCCVMSILCVSRCLVPLPCRVYHVNTNVWNFHHNSIRVH